MERVVHVMTYVKNLASVVFTAVPTKSGFTSAPLEEPRSDSQSIHGLRISGLFVSLPVCQPCLTPVLLVFSMTASSLPRNPGCQASTWIPPPSSQPQAPRLPPSLHHCLGTACPVSAFGFGQG